MRSSLVLPLLCSLFICACGDGNAASCDDLRCDDGNPCTVDACDPTRLACESTPAPDATECAVDGEPGLCSAGVCALLKCDVEACDDANPCTTDACIAGTEICAHLRAPDLTACQVGELNGSCQAGRCELDQPPVGEAILEVVVNGFEPAGVSYDIACAPDVMVSGSLSRAGEAWQASLSLPPGECSAQLSATDQDGEVVCFASADFEVMSNTVTELSLVLICSI